MCRAHCARCSDCCASPRRAVSDRFRRSPFCMKIRILRKNPWHPSRRIGSDAALLHAGGRDRQTATVSLYDLRLKRDAVNAANMDVPPAFGTARESVCGMRRSGHPKALDHPKLQVIQCFGSFKASGRPMFRVVQDFRSPKASDHPRLRVAQDFKSPKSPGSKLRS